MSLDVSTSETEGSVVPTVELSVVVPAYREGRRIHANLTRLLDELEKLGVPYEVVVVSDGNTDATVREALRVESSKVKVFHYPMNIGKGFALVDFGPARDQHRGSLRRESFDFFDQPRTVHAGHAQVGEHQINPAAAESFEREFATVAGNHAVAPRLKQDFADGE